MTVTEPRHAAELSSLALPQTEGPSDNGVRRAPMRLSEYRFLLAAADLLTINLSLWVFLAGWDAAALRSAGAGEWTPFAALSALWLVLAHAFGAYGARLSAHPSTATGAAAKAAAVTAIVYVLIPFLPPPLSVRAALVVFPVLAGAVVLGVRTLAAGCFPPPVFERRAVFLAKNGSAFDAIDTLLRETGGACRLVGRFSTSGPSDNGAGNGAASAHTAWPVQGMALKDAALARGATTVVVEKTDAVQGELLESLVECAEAGIEIIPLSVLFEQLTGRVHVAYSSGHGYAALPVALPSRGAIWRGITRVMDIVLASVGLAALGILLPLIAAAIRLDSPGPIFYVQDRVGRAGRLFRVYKFRSMVRGAESGSALWAQENDDRTTRVGRFLRASHLDELPQFLNVLRGEMSMVGPRPERPEFVPQLVREIPLYNLRHSVKPGMAGWALIHQGYARSEKEALLKLQYDLYYIKHQTLSLDLVIILKTIARAFSLRGR